MSVVFTPVEFPGSERGEFIRFMTRNSFPFHLVTDPTEEQVAVAIDRGAYGSPGRVVLWVDDQENGRIGTATVEGRRGTSPSFDLRLGTRYRGHGLGVPILTALTTHVFTELPAATRLEGRTREDHGAMRMTFARAGFLKEAHFRDGWTADGGENHAAVVYSILRRDWLSGESTPVEWDDHPPATP